MDRVDEKIINYDLIEDVLEKLTNGRGGNNPFVPTSDSSIDDEPSTHGPEGSVLIFLPGIGEIRSLTDRLRGSRRFGNEKCFLILPLHSSLSPQDQRKVFSTPPKGCRKIILSTNMAETSVTIPDVVCGTLCVVCIEKTVGL